MRFCIVLTLLVVPTFVRAGEKPAVVLKHDGWVAAVAFSPDGKTLASAGADKVVRLWEVGSWKAKGVLKGHTDCVCAVAFAQDSSKYLGTGSYDHTARIWDVTDARELHSFKEKGAVNALVAWSLTKPTVLTGCVDGHVRVCDSDGRARQFQ